MALQLRIGKCSLVGNYRESNEDTVEVQVCPDSSQLHMITCLVCDGMGGQQAGEKASQMAAEIIPRELSGSVAGVRTAEDIRREVRRAVVQANEEIIAMGQLDREYRNMGTTVVAAVWVPDYRDDELFVAGVGDSRAYLVRGNKIEQLTVDHSLAQALVEARSITPEEAREHRFKNVLWKYLGTREVGDGPDVRVISIQPGDQLLLCSDGITGAVTDAQLLETMLATEDAQACAEQLCQLALDCGSKDNVSTTVIQCAQE